MLTAQALAKLQNYPKNVSTKDQNASTKHRVHQKLSDYNRIVSSIKTLESSTVEDLEGYVASLQERIQTEIIERSQKDSDSRKSDDTLCSPPRKVKRFSIMKILGKIPKPASQNPRSSIDTDSFRSSTDTFPHRSLDELRRELEIAKQELDLAKRKSAELTNLKGELENLYQEVFSEPSSEFPEQENLESEITELLDELNQLITEQCMYQAAISLLHAAQDNISRKLQCLMLAYEELPSNDPSVQANFSNARDYANLALAQISQVKSSPWMTNIPGIASLLDDIISLDIETVRNIDKKIDDIVHRMEEMMEKLVIRSDQILAEANEKKVALFNEHGRIFEMVLQDQEVMTLHSE